MNKIKLYWNIISPVISILLIGIIVFFAVGLALSIPVCLLWNWLMPYIFGLPTLNVLQSFGLSILVTLLSAKKIDFPKKDVVSNIETNTNDKLEKVLEDITSQFNK